MIGYFRAIKDAFSWQKKLDIKQLLLFALYSVLAYIFLVGLYLVGASLAIGLYTPLMDSLTADSLNEITAIVLLAFKVILAIPLIMHVIKTLVRGITAATQ
ncbi:hypothetical protein [Cronobacter dublinensis]|uniref:hypothetical protein n=1 Tax=Cronobacter dublinensis TaxID=413497 RepID=UPI0024AED46C|nr:hypothetical protein [Cronobacter dublinensis]MDI7504535.1 hypothetical protein [Cronobacter dublinensis]